MRDRVIGATRWRLHRRVDPWAALTLLLPLIAKLPLLMGLLYVDPFLLWGNVSREGASGQLNLPSIDPNVGWVSQALGSLSARLVWHGHAVWWNHFEGVGMPLAGEMQSAALFPLTWLLLWPKAQVLEHVGFQMIAAGATYALLRRLALARPAAWLGATAFAFNGTFALLANAVINPVCFLPVILLGVELADRPLDRAGWLGSPLIAGGLAASIYAGFPEVAYLNGILVALWALVRLGGRSWRGAGALIARLAVPAVCGVLLASPILIAFADFLRVALVGEHGGATMASRYLSPDYLIGLVIPYFSKPRDQPAYWLNVGGYAGFATIVLALLGTLGAREAALRRVLAGWVLFCLAVTFGFAPAIWLIHLVPFTRAAALYRYLDSSWELALAVLCGFAADDLLAGRLTQRRRLLVVAGVGLATAGACAFAVAQGLRPTNLIVWVAVAVSLGFLAALSVALLAASGRRFGAWPVLAVAAVEMVVLFAVPMTRYRRHLDVQDGAVAFLQPRLGLQRFVTTGPVAANFGSRFGLAQVNHNDLPVPKAWVDYATAHLGRDINPIDLKPTSARQLAQHLDAYRAIGVRYALTYATETLPGLGPVYQDPLVRVFDLGEPSAYVDAPGCRVSATDRDVVSAVCDRPSSLRRLELFMPGWTARVNDLSVPVRLTGDIFQSVDLPRGRSEVRFSFTPPFMTTGYALFALGAVLLAGWTIATAAGVTRRRGLFAAEPAPVAPQLDQIA